MVESRTSLYDTPTWSESSSPQSRIEGALLTSTSNLVPLPVETGSPRQDEDVDLQKSCPQYIGRRFSNARRSAQILPEEVQSVIEHKLDLSGDQESDLVTTSETVPLSYFQEELWNVQQEKRELLRKLEHTKETLFRQQDVLDKSNAALAEASHQEQASARESARRKEFDRIQERSAALQEANAEQQATIELLQTELSRFKASIRPENNDQSRSGHTSETGIKELKQEVEQLQAQRVTDSILIESLQQQLQEFHTQHLQLLDAINRLKEAEREVTSLQGQLVSISQENGSLRAQALSQQAVADALASHCRSLEARLQKTHLAFTNPLPSMPADEPDPPVSVMVTQPLPALGKAGPPMQSHLLRGEPTDARLGASSQAPAGQQRASGDKVPKVKEMDHSSQGSRQVHARPAGIVGPQPATGGIFASSESQRQSSTGSATARCDGKPYATEVSLQEFMERTKQLETQLMEDNRERELLEGEMVRVSGSGRTLAERNRRAAAEDRLDFLRKEIGTIRMQLKQMGAMRT